MGVPPMQHRRDADATESHGQSLPPRRWGMPVPLLTHPLRDPRQTSTEFIHHPQPAAQSRANAVQTNDHSPIQLRRVPGIPARSAVPRCSVGPRMTSAGRVRPRRSCRGDFSLFANSMVAGARRPASVVIPHSSFAQTNGHRTSSHCHAIGEKRKTSGVRGQSLRRRGRSQGRQTRTRRTDMRHARPARPGIGRGRTTEDRGRRTKDRRGE